MGLQLPRFAAKGQTPVKHLFRAWDSFVPLFLYFFHIFPYFFFFFFGEEEEGGGVIPSFPVYLSYLMNLGTSYYLFIWNHCN